RYQDRADVEVHNDGAVEDQAAAQQADQVAEQPRTGKRQPGGAEQDDSSRRQHARAADGGVPGGNGPPFLGWPNSHLAGARAHRRIVPSTCSRPMMTTPLSWS